MIIINDLIKKYNNTPFLNIPALNIEQGSAYAIIGTNGCGKSTLIKLVARIIKADSGIIEYPQDINIAYMPQKSFAFNMSVKNNLSFCIKGSIKDKKIIVDDILGKLDLIGLKNAKASRLSGGELQKMALARTLAREHNIILLDEPTASMDISSVITAEKCIKEYIKRYNCTLVFATHSIQQAERLSDYAIFMDNGKIVEKNHTRTLLNNTKAIELKNFLEFL